jgi:hypothetical protein
MMNVDLRETKSKFGGGLAQHMEKNDRIDAAGEPDCDALPAQIVCAQERAHRALSARQLP